jgi:hypothetical protein
MPFYIKHKETGLFLYKQKHWNAEIEFRPKKPRIYATRGNIRTSLDGELRQRAWNVLPEEERSRRMQEELRNIQQRFSGVYAYTDHDSIAKAYALSLWWREYAKKKTLEELLPPEWELIEWKPE